MKAISNSIIRSVCSLVIGVLLVVWPETAIVYLVIAIGALFLIPALVSVVNYFLCRKDSAPQPFPLVAIGSGLFGMWLIGMPGFFVNILMYVLGAVLVIAGIQLIANLLSSRKYSVVTFGYYVIPILVLLAGTLVILNPFATASIPFIILGVSCICYALSDLINYYKFRTK